MIVSLFRRNPEKKRNARIVDAVYQSIVDIARHPVLYGAWGVPDTPLGRYESLSAHMIVFLHRTRGGSKAIEALAQEVLDEFFIDVDHSIRELGIGDAGVPKRMKKLGKMFYGRMGPYWQGLDDNQLEPFRDALDRNVRPGDADKLESGLLAAYLCLLRDAFADTTDDELLSGTLKTVEPDAETARIRLNEMKSA